MVLLYGVLIMAWLVGLDKLFAALSDEQLKDEASGVIRSLIDKIILSPSEGKTMGITLVGDLAGLLSVATKATNPLPESDILLMQVKMVAGACNTRNLRRDKAELKQLLIYIAKCLSMPDAWYLCHA